MKILMMIKQIFRNNRGNFGSSPSLPAVKPLNTEGIDANAAEAAARAAQEEEARLKRERGAAANILTDSKSELLGGKRKTLLGE